MPTPDVEADDHPIVLFDGVCNLCTGAVRFLVPRDSDGILRFAPLQSEVGADLLAGSGLDPGARESIVLVEDGECYRKSDAALRIAAHLDGAWPLLRYLLGVPRPLRDAVYDLIARYRYDVFGRKDRCMVPTEDLRDRFLATSDGENSYQADGDEDAAPADRDGTTPADGDDPASADRDDATPAAGDDPETARDASSTGGPR